MAGLLHSSSVPTTLNRQNLLEEPSKTKQNGLFTNIPPKRSKSRDFYCSKGKTELTTASVDLKLPRNSLLALSIVQKGLYKQSNNKQTTPDKPSQKSDLA